MIFVITKVNKLIITHVNSVVVITIGSRNRRGKFTVVLKDLSTVVFLKIIYKRIRDWIVLLYSKGEMY